MTDSKKTQTVEVTGKVKDDAPEARERLRVEAGSETAPATGDTVEVKLVRVTIQRELAETCERIGVGTGMSPPPFSVQSFFPSARS